MTQLLTRPSRRLGPKKVQVLVRLLPKTARALRKAAGKAGVSAHIETLYGAAK